MSCGHSGHSVPSFTRCATQQAEGIEICQLDLMDAVGVVTRRGCGKYRAQNPRCGRHRPGR